MPEVTVFLLVYNEKTVLRADCQRLRFFHLPQRGPGAAFATALQTIDSPCIATLDIDLSLEPEFAPVAVNLLKNYDVVVGSKRQVREEWSLFRVFGSWLYID